jgi:hypothetical protein
MYEISRLARYLRARPCKSIEKEYSAVLTTLKKQSKRVAVNVWYRNTMRNIQTAS